MTGNRTDKQQLDAWQGVAAFIGITLGLLPLVQIFFGRGPGLWRVLLAEEPGAYGYVLPVVVIVLCVAVVARLEAIKRAR